MPYPMKIRSVVLGCFAGLFLLPATSPRQAQWLTQQATLVPACNAVYLEGQPESTGGAEVFANQPVESVWKWNRRTSTFQSRNTTT